MPLSLSHDPTGCVPATLSAGSSLLAPIQEGEQLNYSEIVGSALWAGISTYSYHPRGDRNVSHPFSVWGTQVGYDTITIAVKEFWPDIRRKLQKKE